jgi:hypothetical protein
VQIPGLNFQIGGGLGMDPALTDPSMLSSGGQMGNMFSQLSDAYGGINPPKAVSRDRNPSTGGPRQAQQRKPEGF